MATLAAEYERRTPASRRLAQRANAVMPGGNTRTCAHFDPYPLVPVRGEGAFLWDGDDNRYIDLNCNGLALIHGQAFPPVVEALTHAARQGTAWGGPNESQVELAAMLCERVPSAERVRFCSTGSEAGMLAAKLARVATGRPLLLKAWFGYHGGYDDLEAGLHHHGELPGRVRLARYGDAADFERVLAEDGAQIAAIVIEPASVTGAVEPPADFLPRLRAAADRAGALLILDECITFRSSTGGLQHLLGVTPDITMLGKFIGGGVPLGAIAGRQDVMRHLDPGDPEFMYHSGSYNGNRLSTGCGVVTLKHLDADAIAQMNAHAEQLERAIADGASAAGVPLTVARVCSMLGFHFFTDAPELKVDPLQDRAREIFHLAAVNAGVFFVPWDGVAGMSTALTDAIVRETGERLAEALQACAGELRELNDSHEEQEVASR